MTQITRKKSVPMRGLILLLTVTLGAGLVLVGCGDDDTATTPAPAPPPPPPPPAPEPEPEPEPPAPEAPATPTGLMVSETTETSITWTWNASEGALGYAVQVSLDEMFDDTDQIGLTLETSFTATPLPPNTSAFLRVRAGTGTPEALAAAVATGALEGLALSDWTTHVTGMSNMPPPEPEPEPEPMAAVRVDFMAPDGKYPMVPDDDARPTHAMATVNTKMTVTSNTTAVITPMFVEDAAGVSVIGTEESPAENIPFTYVDWGMLQADVISGGATFMVQRTVMGANQEMEPTGDTAYVTCGPFSCTDGMDRPDFSIEDSPVCAGWDPTLELQVGLIDNDVFADTDDANNIYSDGDTQIDADERKDDGIDIGWVTTSSAHMTVKHHFEGVAKGQNFNVSSNDQSRSSGDRPVDMDRSDDNNTIVDNQAYRGAIRINQNDTVDTVEASVPACVPESEGSFSYAETIGANHRPDSCFRLTAVGGVNYLSGYSVELAAKDSEVSWGDVDWEDEPFADLECNSVTFVASDMVDVCDMFEAEVDQAYGTYGWGGRFSVVNVELGDADALTGKIRTWTAALPAASPDRFKTLWFDDNLDDKIHTRASDVTNGRGGPNDIYNDNGDENSTTVNKDETASVNENNLTVIWQNFHDADSDPRYGDIGKVDLTGADRVGGTAGNDRMNPDGVADNYTADARPCSDADGEGCDAEWSNDYEVLFADGAFGCTTTRMVTVTCEWDAQGGLGDYTTRDHDSILGLPTGAGDGISGTEYAAYEGIDLVEAGEGLRTPGDVDAFLECEIK